MARSAVGVLATALAVLVAVALVLACAIYLLDVTEQVHAFRDELGRTLDDNCQNETQRSKYEFIGRPCLQFEAQKKIGFARKAMDIVIADFATLVLTVMNEYQPFDANYVKVIVLVLVILGFYLVRDYSYYAFAWAVHREPRHESKAALMARPPCAFASGPLPTNEAFVLPPSLVQ